MDTKKQLANMLKNWMASITPDRFGEDGSIEIRYINETNLGATLSVKHPSGLSRHYEIKVKEVL